MRVVAVVEEDVADKIDTIYIESQFPNLKNTGITYICTRGEEEEDEWVDERGIHHILICLPYEEVKRMGDVRPLMLAKAKERLGLIA